LNADGLDDLVVVLRNAKDPASGKLAVYLGQPGGAFKLLTSSAGAVCVGCSQMAPEEILGDPEITPKGILVLSYRLRPDFRLEADTQAAWRINKKGALVLIGYTITEWDRHETAAPCVRDANLSTLKMNDSCGKVQSCHLDSALKATELSDFTFQAFDVGHCPEKIDRAQPEGGTSR
jgi:hypothetical protein